MPGSSSTTLTSALQRHASFFDANRDGKISPKETYGGLRRLGMGRVQAAGAAAAINAGLAPSTNKGLGRATLDIDIKNIKAGKHAGDTGFFDANGQFQPALFEKKFAKASADGKTLTETELLSMRDPANGTASKLASSVELPLLFKLAHDTTAIRGGKRVDVISKAQLKSFYVGDLFDRLAKK